MKGLKVLGVVALTGFMCMTTLTSCGDDKPNLPKKEQPNPDKPNPDKPNPDKPNPDKPNPDKPGKDSSYQSLGEGWAIPVAPMTNFDKSGYEVYSEVQKYCKANNLTLEQKEQTKPEGDEPGIIQYDLVVNKNPDFPVFQYFFSYKIKEGTTNEASLMKLVGARTVSPNANDKMTSEGGITDFVKTSLTQMGFIELKKYDPNNGTNGYYWNEKLGVELTIGDLVYGDWKGFPTMFYFTPAKEKPQV